MSALQRSSQRRPHKAALSKNEAISFQDLRARGVSASPAPWGASNLYSTSRSDISLCLCVSSISFSLFSPSGKQFVAQVSFLLEKIVLTRVLCAALGCSPKLDKKNKNSKSWMYVYKPIPSQTHIQIIKDHPHQYTWATCTLAGITSCWPLASVAGTAGEWSRLTH